MREINQLGGARLANPSSALHVGLVGTASQMVTAAETAAHWGSGMVAGFSTPALVALVENAAFLATKDVLGAAQTTVGVEVNLKHLAATPVGMRVRAQATLARIEGRQLFFNVEAWDDAEKIGQGTHTRFVVDLARFTERLESKRRAASAPDRQPAANTRQTITIRTAQRADVPSVVELSGALFREDSAERDPFMNQDWVAREGTDYFSSVLDAENRVIFLAEAEGMVVGYLTGYTRAPDSMHLEPSAELESMFVRNAFRAQGAGQALANHFLEWCRARAAVRVTVTAYVQNEQALGFYRRLGFQPKELTLEKRLT